MLENIPAFMQNPSDKLNSFYYVILLRLHAAICRVRFVFWRMRNTSDATIRHRLVQVVI